jgi:WD40 repeat protein
MTFSNSESEIRCTVLPGHRWHAISVAWSPDSSRIVSGSYDGTVRIWDAVTGELQQILSGHINSVYSVAWSPDSTRIVSGSMDRTVRIWEDIGDVSRQIQINSSPLVCTDVRKTILSYM